MHLPRRAAFRYLGLLVCLTVIIGSTQAAGVWASSSPNPPFTECPAVGSDTSCGLLINVEDGGSSVITDPSQHPYDGSEDTLVGIANNSSTPVSSVSLSSGTAIFSFDSDGLCNVTPKPGGCPFDSTGYGGPGVSFANIAANGDSGLVKFSPALAPGASAYFSLEGALTAATINYAAGPPSASITTPADNQTYAINQTVGTSFACTEAINGPGIASCKDENAATSPGALNTATPGSFTYTVTATSTDGQSATATIHYTVAGPPSAAITTPADNQTYAINQTVGTSFACTEATNGPGIASCKDENAATSPGALKTSTAGVFTYTVTATSTDGQTATATIHYTVAGPPLAAINTPADNQTYNVNQAVGTSFTCTEATNGPGIATCKDQNASTSPGTLNTATPGSFTYTVTATSIDGQSNTATIHYKVIGPPSATINTPADNQTYTLNQAVGTSFTCTEATNGPGIATCKDQNASTSPGALNTATAGSFTYTVTATSIDGQSTTATIHYTVVGPPSATINTPADNQTYTLNQAVGTSFTCTEATNGPGIATCKDENASTSPGALNTATAGSFTYTVTATSIDGQSTTATIHYTVIGPPSAAINTPADNQTYNVNQAVGTSFTCTEATNGPGIATCKDEHAATSPGALNTSTAGVFTYTVTATSIDGQSATATIHYTVVGPPSATISAPADNQTYVADQVVSTSFYCTEASGGPGIATCKDQNGSPNAGMLNTSTPGAVSYTVTATSTDGQTATATIHYTVVSIAPANNGLPVVSGKAQEGKPLTSTAGAWSGAPAPTFSYRWLRCDASGNNCSKPISGAALSAYVPVLNDVGHTLRAAVTATNFAGSVSATSVPTAVVVPAATLNTVRPMISGTPQQGQALAASQGGWTNSPTGFAYQWLRCDSAGGNCAPISKATAAGYIPVSDDVGQTLRVTVTASNAAGDGSATSAQTGLVLIAAPVNTPPPVVSGTTAPGQPLSASRGGWINAPAVFTYQWLQCDSSGNMCTPIPNATSSTYVPVLGDGGHTLRVTVTASNAGGSTSATSVQSALVPVFQASLAAPVLGKTSDTALVSGTVLIRLPGSSTFILLSSPLDVPFGSTIDARLGRVSLTEALPLGAYQTGEFYSGEFVLTQLTNGTTIPTLTGGSFVGCPKSTGKKKGAARIAAGHKKPTAVIRQLWGSAHGHYTTKGRYGSASVSGTIWLTQDRCDGTFVFATKDNVIVIAYAHPKKKHNVRQGHQFFIPAPGY